ncbi:MAG: MBL fold metallo-hydrolase [Chloroflexi bacterium]|nr:MAG: MBL fold metallo-hydrolase [Chloroflexota bacterium]
MIAKSIVPGIYAIPLGFVNTFLLDLGELTLIDAGIAGSDRKILQALAELGKQPADLHHILITHLHTDHTGGLAALRQATGAAVYMHPLEAADYSKGITMRQMQPGPGLLSKVMTRVFASRRTSRSEAAPVDYELQDGQVLDFAGNLQVIQAPGHTAGHVVFLSPAGGGVLFMGDACSHMLSLGWSPIYENREEARRTLRKLASLDFETACFSHGGPITPQANRQFQAKFG